MFNPKRLNHRDGNRRNHRAKTWRRGTVTIEMAMVVPVIFLMFFGSVEFARMMMVRQAFTNAAREGCRNACLATTQSSTTSKTLVRDSLDEVIADVSENGSLVIEVSPEFNASPESGTTITVSVEADLADVSWLPPFFTSGAKIRGTASMVHE